MAEGPVRARLRFRPRLLPTLVALPVAAALAGLGFWQLERAAEKRALLERHAERRAAAPLPALPRPCDLARHRYLRVRLRGRYLADRQILLENRVHRGRVGYHVYSVLVPAGGGPWVLVNRGWIPAPPRRTEAQAPPPPAGEVDVTGMLNRPAAVGLRLGEALEGPVRWPLVLPYLDERIATRALGHEVYGCVVYLDPQAPGGFVREWRIVEFGPERHLAYAVQWFALAAAVLVLWFATQRRRREEGP